MSNKVSPTRGLHRVVSKKRDLGLATKVTGRNLAAVSYITALEAERRGVELELRARFSDNGSLQYVKVYEGDDTFGTTLNAGQYVVLEPHADEAVIMDVEDYDRLFERVDG